MHQDKPFAGSPPASDGVSADHARLQVERDILLASPDFARAPIMKRLLEYLVGETVAGRGDQLKAYAVAVDGLGRAPDYDARADSYPRVQVGRLRRMLASHYRGHPSADGQGLVIPSGRYRVGIASYLPDNAEPSPVTEAGSPTAAGRLRPMAALLLVAAIVAIGLVLAWIVPIGRHAPIHGRHRPMLELTVKPIDGGDSNLRNMIRGSLLDGLRRSAVFDVRMVRRTPSAIAQPPAPYRLATEVVGGPRPHVFLRLWHRDPDRILWSNTITLPRDAADGTIMAQLLAPAISAIGRVEGLVAANELGEARAEAPSSYKCLLQYHRYRRERIAGERAGIERCVERGLANDPDDAALHAAAANLALTHGSQNAGALSRLDTAQRHAQMATSIDPLNAWANVAQAHIAVLRNACPQAVNDAARAVELDPFDPVLIAEAGLDILSCGDARAEPLIRRAITLDDGPEGRFHALLVLVAVDRGDKDLARDTLARMTAPLIGRHPRFYLFSATGYAMVGDREKASAAWASFVASAPHAASDPDAYLARLGIAPPLRAKAMGMLRGMGLVAT